MTYLDVWRSGTSLLYSCKAAFWIQETSPILSDVERSVVLRSVLQSVGHPLTCCFLGNLPLLHTSRYVIPRDSVLPGLPRVSTASDKRWGEKAWERGYKDSAVIIIILSAQWKYSVNLFEHSVHMFHLPVMLQRQFALSFRWRISFTVGVWPMFITTAQPEIHSIESCQILSSA